MASVDQVIQYKMGRSSYGLLPFRKKSEDKRWKRVDETMSIEQVIARDTMAAKMLGFKPMLTHQKGVFTLKIYSPGSLK